MFDALAKKKHLVAKDFLSQCSMMWVQSVLQLRRRCPGQSFGWVHLYSGCPIVVIIIIIVVITSVIIEIVLIIVITPSLKLSP